MKILIVEDEQAIASGLKFNFEQEKYDVVVAGDGPTALDEIRQAASPFDVVILDLMLPSMSGYETCREIRKIDSQVPVLVLSARTLSEDKAMAFDCGSDQYMTKPFALPELLARVRNLTERHLPGSASGPAAGDDSSGQHTFGPVQIDFRKFEATVTSSDGKVETVPLTTTEAELLRYLIEHEGEVLSRVQILRDVWGHDADVTTRTIDNFVMRLRKLLDTDAANSSHIRSVRGTGYQFVTHPEPPSPDESTA